MECANRFHWPDRIFSTLHGADFNYAECTEQILIRACKLDFMLFMHGVELVLDPRSTYTCPNNSGDMHLHVKRHLHVFSFFNFLSDVFTLVGICTGLDHSASAVWLKTSFVSSQKLINVYLWVCAVKAATS